MSRNTPQPNVWANRIALFVFGVLIALSFGLVHPILYAIGVGILISLAFVVFVKITGIEPGWPRD
ncbi:MAG: hypothetical protein KC435_05755 [Thermomicrobiales bacterium]|nr:hypothetical protein [Thermomicrobiales bacterium]